jgi:glycosyltransferase involved in cell wall biosynthesis
MKSKSTSTPLISIVLCTYNGELYLNHQLESVLNQTYTNLEIIISDDASTDATKNILKEYEGKERLKIYYQKENLGYIKNFVFALNQSNGEFIALSDQDDIWLPDKIETLYNLFEEELLVYSNSLLIDNNGKSMHLKLSDLRNMYSGRNSKGFFLFNIVWGHALMMRKELLKYALPIPESIPHDIWFAYKATTLTGIKYCNKVLTHYRQHQDAYTNTLLPKNVKTRTMSKRFEYYLKQLHWLFVMKEHASNEEREFYCTFYNLFRKKEKGKYRFSLFFFAIKHQHELYRFSKKNFISRLIDIRKIARGEKG